jgi:putative membrane protein
MRFLQRWLVNTVAVMVAAQIPWIEIHYSSWGALLGAALLLGVLNALLRPLLLILSLPLVVFSLGLFVLVINALLLYFVGVLMGPAFDVDTFGSAFLGGLVISVVTLIMNTLSGTGERRIDLRRPAPRRTRRGPPPGPAPGPPPGEGPVIDV